MTSQVCITLTSRKIVSSGDVLLLDDAEPLRVELLRHDARLEFGPFERADDVVQVSVGDVRPQSSLHDPGLILGVYPAGTLGGTRRSVSGAPA